MSDEKFVPSELHARASVDLQREVEDELAKPDPQGETAQAAIREAIKASSENEQTGED